MVMNTKVFLPWNSALVPPSFHLQTSDEAGDHHFRKPANDITSQLDINFGDLGRPGRGRGGPRGGRGGRGGGGSRTARGGGRSEKVTNAAFVAADSNGLMSLTKDLAQRL